MSDPEPPTAGVTRLAAYAVCQDEAERILLTRLAPSVVDPGLWTLPGGGIEFGEAPAAAALRELTEETGLVGELLSLAEVESRVFAGSATASGDDMHAIRFLYRVRVTGGALRDEIDGSTDAAAWFTRAEVADLPIVDLVESALRLLDGH